MIAKLTGLVDQKGAGDVILDVNGVGYLVQASAKTLDSVPAQGEAVSLLIETQVREDAITLFGFAGSLERDMFRLLTSVQGVGAKVGLAILSVLDPPALQTAIAAQDKGMVAQANGVGPKLAGRIVNELKDKVATVLTTQALSASASASTSGSTGASQPADSGVIEDAVAGLVALGYRPGDAHGAAARALTDQGDSATVQSLITASLKELSRL